MRISLFIGLFLLTGCKHFGLLFKPPGTLKAIIQGKIKGADIYCEKTLVLDKKRWEVMCKVSDEINIKYRTKPLHDNRTKLELIINKKKNQKDKIIAAPIMIVKKGKPAALRAISAKTVLSIKALPMP